METIQTTAELSFPEYWEEFWRLEVNCCHSNPSEDHRGKKWPPTENYGLFLQHMDEINPKIFAKEGKLGRYWERVKNFNKTGHLKITKEIFTYRLMEGAKTNQQLDAKETKWFLSKISKRKVHNRNSKLINNMEK